MKKIKIGLTIFCTVFLIFLSAMFFDNIFIIKDYSHQLADKEITFSEFTKSVAGAYRKELKQKEIFLNLNGLFVRSMNQNVSNERVITKNGILLKQEVPLRDMTQQAIELVNLDQWLRASDIPFLFVNMPTKMDLKGELQVTGVDNFENENCDNLLKILEENHVDYIDLRKYQSVNAAQVKENFYRTDHHWTPEAALDAASIILEHLQEEYPKERFPRDTLDPEQWDIFSKPEWFLGSSGKRVGSTLVGTDDLIWAVPQYDTQMSFIVPFGQILKKGSFEETLIHDRYIKDKDYFHSNPYCVYIGDEYGLVQHRNPEAPIHKKLLIVKDSFMLPLESFLSTAFQELEVVDLRYLDEFTLTEHIRGYEPDMVMVAHTINVGDDDFGHMDRAAKASKDMSVSYYAAQDSAGEQKIGYEIPRLKDISIFVKSRSHGYSHEKILSDLLPDMEYQVRIKKIQFSEGQAQEASIVLWDSKADHVLQSVEYDLEKDNASGDFLWTFHTPETSEGPMHLLIYSGLRGSAEEKALTAYGVNVMERHTGSSLDIPGISVEHILENRVIELKANRHSRNNVTLLDKLEYGKKYTLQFDRAEFTEGEGDGISIIVYDTKTEKMLRAEICDVEVCNNSENGFQWSFCAPGESEGDLRLIVYAGIQGHTKDNGIRLYGVDLTVLN